MIVLRRAAVVALMLVLCSDVVRAQSVSSILHELRSFQQMGRVLYLAAHPDDENTQLIAYLTHGRGYRTGYLSLTRGGGGQNLIGNELGDGLAAIRTQELLAARAIDGGEQFFSRAEDFGYSKDYREALEKWNHEEVLSDVVLVVRTFRPDVIITRFSPESMEGMHGHHTASARLAIEAYELSGDPSAFPEQLEFVAPWQPKRVLWNRFGGGNDAPPGVVPLDVGGYDPISGMSFGEIAALSRSMHKSQGFGAVGTRGSRVEHFHLLAGEPATSDVFDGIDASWGRVAGGDEIGRRINDIIGAFDPAEPSASVPALLEVRRLLGELTSDEVIADKRRQLGAIIQAALGLHVETVVPRAEVVPGEPVPVRHTAIVRSDAPVRWLGVRPQNADEVEGHPIHLRPNRSASRDTIHTLPREAPLSRPHWMMEGERDAAFDDPFITIRPENPPVLGVEHVFEVDGERISVGARPAQVIRDPVRGEVQNRLEVIPPVFLRFDEDVVLVSPGADRSVELVLSAERDEVSGSVRLEVPTGWQVDPAAQPFSLARAGERTRLAFTITAPSESERAEIGAIAEVDGMAYSSRRQEIAYDHIPRLLLQPPARLIATSLELDVAGTSIGYLPGAGDRVPESLERMGYTVTRVTGADLTPEALSRFDAVVLGVRAFNTRSDLPPNLPALFRYVESGGTVVVQYNTSQGLLTNDLAPFDLDLGRDRITDETADLALLEPDHPALNIPNEISAADFENWVQERGLYFAEQWDDAFTPILAGSDPDEEPSEGALLVARYGAGYFVYTGLSFFRQLPAGVPGAYRLFANLVSLGNARAGAR